MNLWVAVGGFLIAVAILWGAYSKGWDAGLAEGEQLRAEAVVKKAAEMMELEVKHSKDLKEFQLKLSVTERQANEKIRKLLLENTELKTWWEIPIPTPAVEYAWGVHDDVGNGAMSGGPGTAIENPVGGAAR